MADASKAVFLSYAREDAEAARRIADALRSHGVEVWFDQSELRGGDAWDAKIRKQINDCALFLPIISQHTQDRGKGYFRLEWKLAVEQTHLMVEGMVFLAPVVVDATPENGALVPPEFMRVHWTRLPGALPTPQFVEQVKQLLVGKPVGAPPQVPGARPDHVSRPESGMPRKSHTARWSLGMIVAIAVGISTALMVSNKKPAPIPAPPPVAEIKPAAVPAVSDKSIAVLPFTNMSEEKDSAFFADGMHEDILTSLARIHELRVVSRTSVMQFRNTTKAIGQVAKELGVAYILEGSVRRAGNKVRVTGQLIHAATDEHVWAQSYDRDLTDVFAIQAALSQEIATALSAALSPQEKSLLDHKPTSNPAAYDLFLKARQMNRDGNDTPDEFIAEEGMLQTAVTLDPNFAAAWAALCETHAQMRFIAADYSEARLAKAKDAMDTARRLEPDNPDVISGSGAYYYYGLRDYPRALEQFERLVQKWPNNYFGFLQKSLVLRRQGKWVESLATMRRAQQLDPGSAEVARNLVVTFRAMRRYDDAIVEQARRVRLLPESLRESFELTRLNFFARGSTRETDELLAGPIAERAGATAATGYRKLWACMKGDLATVVRLDRESPDAWGMILGGFWTGNGARLNAAYALAASGDQAGARARIESLPAELRARLVSEPNNSGVWCVLAQAEALLGHREESLAAAGRALEIMPESVDSLIGINSRFSQMQAYALTGDKDKALAVLQRLFDTSGNVNVHTIKQGPWLAVLKGDPRFEAMVNDPKNNAPLF